MLSNLIPSMFARRLLLMGLLLVLSAIIPAVQLFRLTVIKGDEHRREAESRLISEKRLPTHRGRIVDRKGRVLAVDRPSYDIAVDYQVITGRWAFSQAARAARKAAGSRWSTLSPEEREALVNDVLPEYEERLYAMWTQFAFTAGVPREEVEQKKNEIRLQVQSMASTVWANLDRRSAEAREAERDKAIDLGNEDERAIEVGAAPTSMPPSPADRRHTRPEIQEQKAPHIILHGVDDRTAFAFLRLASGPPSQDATAIDPTAPPPLPGLRVIDGSAREYPLETIEVAIDRSTFPSPLRSPEPMKVRVEGVATHIVGWMRDRLHPEDRLRRLAEVRERAIEVGAAPTSMPLPDTLSDLGRYEPGDNVGGSGIENAAEFDLRGLRGLEILHLDTGEPGPPQPPKPGDTVRLALDIMLQARVQALFDPSLGLAVVQPWYSKDQHPRTGQPVHGAAVIIDVDTGDILAMVTAPTFTREQLRSAPPYFLYPKDDKAEPDHPRPGLNRAIAKSYQPGSIVKPLILCGATTGGFYQPAQRIECTGHLLPDKPTIYQCWTWKQYKKNHNIILGHDLDGSDAIMGSCNIFFFEMGRRMGPAAISEWYTRFGVGPRAVHPDLGLGSQARDGGEVPTLFPGSVGRMGSGGALPSPSEAILMGIGQGPIAWTPLHAADAYATIARAGLRIPPRLRLDSAGQPAPIDLGIDPRAVEQALSGLRRGVEEHDGTTNHLEIPPGSGNYEPILSAPGIIVWGKSGTATARITKGTMDLNNDGKLDDVYTDHAWCVCLAGPAAEGRPRYAIAVVADEAGSGGKAAGPIANQVIHALMAEGYLPGGSAITAAAAKGRAAN